MSAGALTTRWWWVRHAPVTVNRGCCYGQTDFPCDVSDKVQFAGLAKRLPERAAWVTSPLKRTHMTAAALVATGLDGPDPIPGPGVAIERDLIEQHFGEWQGVRYDELAARRGEDWHRFWLAPAHETPPGGESFVALMHRVHGAIARLNEQFAGRDILAITHGGDDPRGAGVGARALARSGARLHDRQFVADAHRSYSGAGCRPWLARQRGEPATRLSGEIAERAIAVTRRGRAAFP